MEFALSQSGSQNLDFGVKRIRFNSNLSNLLVRKSFLKSVLGSPNNVVDYFRELFGLVPTGNL